MTKIITYSLKNSAKNSDLFYVDLSIFTDIVIQKAEEQLSSVLDDLGLWLDASNEEGERTRAEYIFDMLVLGVLWRVHAAVAASSSGWMQNFLARLVDAQGRHYGDGIAYVHHRSSAPKGGRNLYVWQRMPELLGVDRLLLEVLRIAAEKAKAPAK